ncbi:hypothetical protein ACN28G_17660 [Micromonospora sp. WMMA1923]|uniref:hypothetical protein n=1 Tax=Micromonospora sp. WMMA1923 TaxID=3404125 RepID=UPI003B965B51
MDTETMKDFFGRFWTMVVSMAGLVGLYLGAVQVDLTWAFWAVIGLAAVGTSVSPIRRWVADTRARIRSYPAMEAESASLRDQLEALEKELADARASADERYAAGLNEGAARIVGTIMSADAKPPTIIALAERNGAVALVARYDGSRPDRRLRFTVVASGSGEIKGAVGVLNVDESRRVAYLKCIDAISHQFWSHLEQRMAYDSSAPKGIELVRYIYNGDRLIVDEVALTEAVEPAHPEGEK